MFIVCLILRFYCGSDPTSQIQLIGMFGCEPQTFNLENDSYHRMDGILELVTLHCRCSNVS